LDVWFWIDIKNAFNIGWSRILPKFLRMRSSSCVFARLPSRNCARSVAKGFRCDDGSWNTKKPLRRMSIASWLLRYAAYGLPSICTSSSSGSIRPAIASNISDLPIPDSPSRRWLQTWRDGNHRSRQARGLRMICEYYTFVRSCVMLVCDVVQIRSQSYKCTKRKHNAKRYAESLKMPYKNNR